MEFDKWLRGLKKAWEGKDPEAAANLCAEELLWYETPFDEPLKTKEDVLKEWRGVLNQEDISVAYEILSIKGKSVIARWSATFHRLPSKEKVRLNGIFMVTLNEEGKCTEFHQWYNSK